MAMPMKSLYMNSAMGRLPVRAAPMPRPAMAASAMGVSTMRSGPPFLQQALGDGVRAAPDADFLTNDKHGGVAGHFLVDGLAQGFAHEDFAGGGVGRGRLGGGDGHDGYST